MCMTNTLPQPLYTVPGYLVLLSSAMLNEISCEVNLTSGAPALQGVSILSETQGQMLLLAMKQNVLAYMVL